MTKLISSIAAALLLINAKPALAAPAAIVEDLTGSVAGVDVLDYVDAGKVIELKSNASLVLGYLKSCVRETIRGGTVKIGAERSEVTGGTVERKTSPCDGGKLQLTAEQAGKSGAMVFRRPPSQAAAVPAAAVTLHATSPVVTMTSAGTVVFERLDKPDQPISVALKTAKADLATMGVRLEPGGTYRASRGERAIVFKVDASAAAGGGPVIGRLLQF